MRTERGVSQILFGMLPGQTVDLERGIWQVDEWPDPVPVQIDQDTIRRALLRSIVPWARASLDWGLADRLHGASRIEVVAVNPDRGVTVRSYPRRYLCRACGRIHQQSVRSCQSCGGASLSQLQFVAYHSCGSIREPQMHTCPTHDATAVSRMGTATTRELRFRCPVCDRHLGNGFPFQSCACGSHAGGGMKVNVHRAAVVFTPHFLTLVNPPDPATAARFAASGGGARALEWVVEGMDASDPTETGQTVSGMIQTLQASGISEATAQEMAAEMERRGEIQAGTQRAGMDLPPEIAEQAQDEATQLASASAGGRVLVSDLADGTSPPLQTLYEGAYGDAIDTAQLESVELLTNFPVATMAYGYTRDGLEPGSTRLVAYSTPSSIRLYGAMVKTEGLLFKLDPIAVLTYLQRNGNHLDRQSDSGAARLEILRHLEMPSPGDDDHRSIGADVLKLIHSYSHRTVRQLAKHSGIERNGLGEYLLPHHLCFVVYANSRSDFVLGGLQAVFEQSLHRLLDDVVTAEYRCPLDPGCRNGGGACMACLHLGEPSCRWFNGFLDRSVLFGAQGFLSGSEQHS